MNRPTHTQIFSSCLLLQFKKKDTGMVWVFAHPAMSLKVLCEWKTTRYTSLCCGRLVVFNTPPLRCEHYVSSLSLPVRMYQLPHTRYKQVDTCRDLHGISDLLMQCFTSVPKQQVINAHLKVHFFFLSKGDLIL